MAVAVECDPCRRAREHVNPGWGRRRIHVALAQLPSQPGCAADRVIAAGGIRDRETTRMTNVDRVTSPAEAGHDDDSRFADAPAPFRAALRIAEDERTGEVAVAGRARSETYEQRAERGREKRRRDTSRRDAGPRVGLTSGSCVVEFTDSRRRLLVLSRLTLECAFNSVSSSCRNLPYSQNSCRLVGGSRCCRMCRKRLRGLAVGAIALG